MSICSFKSHEERSTILPKYFFEEEECHNELLDTFFPDDIELGKDYKDPLVPENYILFSSYLAAGFVLSFLGTPLAYYLVRGTYSTDTTVHACTSLTYHYQIDDLNAAPSQQAIVFTAAGLPWGLKVVQGLIIDSFPIRGYRRIPYFIIGECKLSFMLQ